MDLDQFANIMACPHIHVQIIFKQTRCILSDYIRSKNIYQYIKKSQYDPDHVPQT